MNARIERAVNGAALAPMGPEEKRELALLARKAWEAEGRPGAFDDWRRWQVLLTVERHGLRDCRHEDYAVVKAHFLAMLGHAAAAERFRLRAATEPRRVARYRLERELEKVADVIQRPREYIAQIARSRFKVTDMDELGEKQLWVLVFDIRRAAQRRRKNPVAAPSAEHREQNESAVPF